MSAKKSLFQGESTVKKTIKISVPQLVISLILVAGLFAGGGFWLAKKDSPKSETSQVQKENAEDLTAVYQLYQTIQQNYYDDVDKETLVQGALKGMTEALDDPYSTYLDATGSAALNESLADSFEGIGATLILQEEWPAIAQTPIKETPAAKAGLKAEDRITAVDGDTTKGLSLDEVVAKIRGENGSKVTLTIQRGEDTFDVVVTRDVIPVETVHGQLDETNQTVGYVQITTFGTGTAKELKETIKDLRKAGAKSFILDVRQNPGGLLEAVQEMASMFLDDGKVIVQFEDSQGARTKTVASSELDGGFKVTEPVVVLVDGNSASAAEIFAAALIESANRPVIGTKTFGKGTMQQVADLDEDSELKLTVAKWLTPKGTWINEKGLAPTIEADYPSFAYLPPISRSANYQLGDRGQEIDYLNQFLAALDYPTSGDSFNEATQAALKEIQAKNNLPVTGTLDGKTADAIELALNASLKGQDFAYQKGIEELTK